MKGEEILKYHFWLKKILFDSRFLSMNNSDCLKFFIYKYGDEAWDLYNFNLTVKYFINSFDGSYTKVASPIYEAMESDLVRKYTDLRIFQLCIENEINEEFDLLYSVKKENFIFKLNLDRILVNDVISLVNIENINILKRTKDVNLKRKIINMNLIYGVFIRFKDLIFFNKRNSSIETVNLGVAPEYSEWGKKIMFTKGYVIIFPNKYVRLLIEYIYRRKIVTLRAVNIDVIRGKTVRDSLKNENYSSPIWMKNLSIDDFRKLEKAEIVNNIIDEKFDSNLLIENLNFINSIKLSPNMDFFYYIEKISKKSKMLDKEYITKDKLEESLIEVKEGVVYIDNEKINEIDQERLNCLTFVNLVKKQYSRFPEFYMQYRRDGRVRIYNYNYPLNFQLSHLVRNTIMIEQAESEEIIERFLELWIWKKINKNISEIFIFFWQKINKTLVFEICKKFDIKCNLSGEIKEKIIENLELESILILLESFCPQKIISLEKRISWVIINCLDKILELDLSNVFEVEKILNLLFIYKKKMHVIKNIYSIQKIYHKKMYDEIFWVDASSNGIQLITLRLGKFNETLLQLTNIIDNKTSSRNIYSYVTTEISNMDHSKFLGTFMDNKITIDEFNLLYNDDDNKDRIMPASYGKGKIRARKDIINYINSDNAEIWNKISNESRDKISDYLWKLVFEILKNIGFDLGLYKEACKNFLGEEEKLVCWYNDCNFPIVPFKQKESKRENLLKKMEILKLNIKDPNTSDDEIKAKIIQLNKEISYDERTFYKRTKITTDDSFITPRIKHTELEIDRLKTLTSLAPNATHSYDASNMDKTLKLSKNVKINVLPIFDSLGGHIKYVCLVKILFKIANIENIENNYKTSKFPHIKIEMSEEDRIKLYIKMLESSYFIR